jgi:hypothetical protein
MKCPGCGSANVEPTGAQERRLFPWQGRKVRERAVFNAIRDGHEEYELRCRDCLRAWWSLARPEEVPA